MRLLNDRKKDDAKKAFRDELFDALETLRILYRDGALFCFIDSSFIAIWCYLARMCTLIRLRVRTVCERMQV